MPTLSMQYVEAITTDTKRYRVGNGDMGRLCSLTLPQLEDKWQKKTLTNKLLEPPLTVACVVFRVNLKPVGQGVDFDVDERGHICVINNGSQLAKMKKNIPDMSLSWRLYSDEKYTFTIYLNM